MSTTIKSLLLNLTKLVLYIIDCFRICVILQTIGHAIYLTEISETQLYVITCGNVYTTRIAMFYPKPNDQIIENLYSRMKKVQEEERAMVKIIQCKVY